MTQSLLILTGYAAAYEKPAAHCTIGFGLAIPIELCIKYAFHRTLKKELGLTMFQAIPTRVHSPLAWSLDPVLRIADVGLPELVPHLADVDNAAFF